MMRAQQTCRVCGVRLPVQPPGAPCDVCGFTWLGTEVGAAYDYEAGYDEHSSYNSGPPDVVLEHYRRAPNTAWALAHLRRLSAERGARSLFEFGASQGAFLSLAREAGYAVHGVELASASIQYGRAQLGLGEALEQGVWRARREAEQPVDVVCAFEVLEHSDDPLGFVAMMRSWLSPGGHALVSVPNGRRLAVRVGRREVQDFPPHHLMYWTRQSLSTAFQRAGFRVLEVTTSALTHSDLLNLAAPKVAARRAVDVGSCRPVDAPTASRGLPGVARLAWPALTAAGRLAARAINTLPDAGGRLMLLAQW